MSLSVFPLRFWSLIQFYKFQKIGGVTCIKMIATRLKIGSRTSFFHIFTKSVEPIFKSVVPISQHTTLDLTLVDLMPLIDNCKVSLEQYNISSSVQYILVNSQELFFQNIKSAINGTVPTCTTLDTNTKCTTSFLSKQPLE